MHAYVHGEHRDRFLQKTKVCKHDIIYICDVNIRCNSSFLVRGSRHKIVVMVNNDIKYIIGDCCLREIKCFYQNVIIFSSFKSKANRSSACFKI